MSFKFVIVTGVVLLELVKSLQATLPQYIPVLGGNLGQRDSLIESYFHLGLNYSEIITFLFLYHGIRICLRQLKRVLAAKGLRRRRDFTPVREVIDAVDGELQGSGCSLGYRAMHQRLQNDHGMVVDRETVRKIIKGLDPDGVDFRSRRKLRRRRYYAKGPNFIWHMDGYDKLKPFGFCIHGAIDGYSRRILWLEVGPSNNDPRVTSQYFIDCIRQVKGIPRVIRSDCGTENVYIAAIQRYLRRNGHDGMAGVKSFLYGKSTANQRIEAWWSILRRTNSNWWINFFKDMRDSGIYNSSNPIQYSCLQFCFMPIVQAELHAVARNWNLHKIRPSQHSDSPPGRPDVLYFLPNTKNTYDLKSEVDEDDLQAAESLCGGQLPPMGCDPTFAELGNIIMQERNLPWPSCPNEAKELYIELLLHIGDI